MGGPWIELLKVSLLLLAALFTYYRFFREGAHQQRIEFDVDLADLGVAGSERILEIGCTAENKGHVEQKFDDIRVTVRGVAGGGELRELAGHAPRLEFPESIERASLISEKYGYFFVRPKVRQRFPLVVRVPATWTHALVRSTFKYKSSVAGRILGAASDVHSAERAFRLGRTSDHS